MFFAKNVNNPNLGGAIELMRTQNTEKSREIVVEEIIQAVFLCPARLSIPPKENEEGVLQLQKGCEIHYVMLQDKSGNPVLPAYTSMAEAKKWEERFGADDLYYFGLTFLEYVDMMLQVLPDGSRGPAQGFVIDPLGHNMIVDRDMVANIMLRLQLRK